MIRTKKVHIERGTCGCLQRLFQGKAFLRNLPLSRDLKDELELARSHGGEQEGMLQVYMNSSGWKGAQDAVGP